MQQEKRKKRVLFLMAVCWMLLIFCFSAQAADDSGELSGSLTWYLVQGFNQIFSMDFTAAAMLEYTKVLEYPVRKLAHMSEYAILAGILSANFTIYEKTNAHKYVFAWLSAVCYAATDEVHQLFVPGRAGLVTDVCIDSAGAALGLGVLWIFIKIRKRIIKNRKR